jgi:hypothetical protein
MATEPEPQKFNAFSVQRWYVGVADSYHFVRDEINVWVAAQTRDDVWQLKPVQFEWVRSEPGVVLDNEQPSMVLPRELAQRMLEAGIPKYNATDAGNVLTKIRDLERQRDFAQQQLNNLIAGIGRLGATTGH